MKQLYLYAAGNSVGGSTYVSFAAVAAESPYDADVLMAKAIQASRISTPFATTVTATATLVQATKVMTQAAAFTGAYELSSGSFGSTKFVGVITGGTDAKKGIVYGTVGSANTVTLDRDISDSGSDLATGDITSEWFFRYDPSQNNALSAYFNASSNEAGTSLGKGVALNPLTNGILFAHQIELTNVA